jgi:hypothetical protein
MEFDDLRRRMRNAYLHHSLRKIGEFCGISHEQVRRYISDIEEFNITLAHYKKVDKGLSENGF